MSTRRDALRVLAGVVAGTGITVTPVTAHEATTDIVLIVLRSKSPISTNHAKYLSDALTEALKGTPLQDVKTLVLDDGLELEVVRGGRAR